MADCTLVILTYKGLSHLEILLPTVERAIDNTPDFAIDVLVIDNGPDDGSAAFVRNKYPAYQHAFSPKNDYLFSYNFFVKSLKSSFVFLSDNDMRLDPDVFNETLPIIAQDERLFAVTCNVKNWEGDRTTTGVRIARYKRGWVDNQFVVPTDRSIRYTLYPGGGAAVFRTHLFNELGGFDTLFRPAYSEDKDLGYRAWQAGHPTVYAPKAIMYHREGGTLNQNPKKRNAHAQLVSRNNMLWMVKNVRYPGFIFWFLVLYPYRLLVNGRKDRNLFKAMLQIIPKMPRAISRRKATSKANDSFFQITNQVYKHS